MDVTFIVTIFLNQTTGDSLTDVLLRLVISENTFMYVASDSAGGNQSYKLFTHGLT